MQTFNKLPNYTRLQYVLNGVTGWYHQTENQNPGINKIPVELKTAPAMQPFLKRQGAKECIKGHQSNYQKFFTGLRSTQFVNLFTGDNINDRPNLILFDFSQDKTELTVYYIGEFKVYPNRLKSFLVFFKSAVIDRKTT